MDMKTHLPVVHPVLSVVGLFDSPTVREQFELLLHSGWTCHSGKRTIVLTHRAGATYRSRAVGAPARWAGVDFPTGINLAHCSDRTIVHSPYKCTADIELG